MNFRVDFDRLWNIKFSTKMYTLDFHTLRTILWRTIWHSFIEFKTKIYIHNYPWIKCKMLQVEVILPPFYTFTHNLKFSAKTILMSSFWTRRDCNSPTMSLSQIISRVRFGYGYGVVAKLNPEYDLVTKAVAKLYTRLC